MSKLEKLIIEIESKITFHEKVNTKVSDASIGWQIEHVLLTLNLIVNALQKPRTEYKWSFKLPRLLVFTLNKIPRGRAKAPKVVQPQESITIESINKQLVLAKQNIKLLETLNKNLFFEHPYLGHMRLKQTEKFLYIHSKHHLKIINDINKA